MTSERRSKLAGIGRWLPGLIISAIAIWLLVRISNWGEVIQSVSLMKPIWLVPVLAVFILSMGLRALAWMVLLQYKAPYGRVFLTLNEGYLLNNVFPFRLGELGRAFLLSQATELSGFFVFSTIVIERAYDLIVAASLLLATLPLVLGVEMGQTIPFTVFFIVVLGLITMFLLARNRQWIKSKLEDYSLVRPVFKERILPQIDSILAGLGVLTRWNQFILSFFLMLLSWFFGAVQLYLLTISFGVEVEFWWIGFVLGVAALGIALPSVPAGLGVYEVAVVGAFSLVGIPASQALAIALVSHFINITVTGFIGLYGIFQDGESVAGLYQRLKNVRYLGGTG